MFQKKSIVYVQYISLTTIAIVFFIPILWLVFASFDRNATVTLRFPQWTMDNYVKVFLNAVNMRAFVNSLIIAMGQAVVTVCISLLAAYPLSRFRMAHKKTILLTLLFLTGLPLISIMIPVYQLFSLLRIMNTFTSTILFMSATAIPFNTWLLRNFMNTVPIDIEEASAIDGATSLQTLVKITLPLMLPGLATVFILSFSGAWGNFFIPYLLLSSPEKMPAAVRIFQYFGERDQGNLILYGQLAAFSILYTIPSAILYFYSQRFMARGFIPASA